MATGKVRWFNLAKGYGFIKPSDGTKDVTLTLAAVQSAGLPTMGEGQAIEYDLVVDRGQATAVNIKLG